MQSVGCSELHQNHSANVLKLLNVENKVTGRTARYRFGDPTP